ncbi:MAG: cysteine hydrolase [Bacteroidetes bacterium]|nr:MAG: cysteine hydrolase [Bacteroidota bacterium]
MIRRSFIILVLLFTAFPFLFGQKTALLIVDVQEFYFPGGRMQLENPELAGMNAGLLLDHFRNNEMLVYHVRHNFEPGGDIHPYVKPQEGEAVFSKDQVNSFAGTGLLEMMQQDSVEQVVICGMQTHMCVEAAVRAAHDFGFTCLVASDACATRALQFEEHIIPAKNVHYSTLSTLQGSYARVITTDAILREFSQSDP